MAHALDIEGAADLLLDVGLAKSESHIVLDKRLSAFNVQADSTTFKRIAKLLLIVQPPNWIKSVVIDGRLVWELIPEGDLEIISWLEDDLEQVVLAAHRYLHRTRDEKLLKFLGDAGEYAVVSALESKGVKVRHVSRISDHFGYDIAIGERSHETYIEVKSAVTSTSGCAILSRNEFDVARRMGERWQLVQVVFSSKVIATRVATSADVEGVFELSSQSIMELSLDDTPEFRWLEAAKICPAKSQWQRSALQIQEGFYFRAE